MIHLVNASDGAPRRLTDNESLDLGPNWSRDQQWIYFTSNRTGEWQVWKIPVAGGQAVQVIKTGGYFPTESADRRVLFYAKSSPPGLWMMPLEGGEAIQVTESLPPPYYCTISDRGIYFLQRTSAGLLAVNLFAFAVNEVTQNSVLNSFPPRQRTSLGHLS